MALTYATVTIDGTNYNSLIALDEADAYLAADPNADAWRALDDNDKGRYLVSATRVLIRQRWKPGVMDDPLPQPIKDATAELASAMAGGYDAANQQTTASGIKRQKAGSVEQEFFAAGTGGVSEGLRFPLPVWELIDDYLDGGGSASGLGGSIASGTCGHSISEIPYDYGYVDYRAWD